METLDAFKRGDGAHRGLSDWYDEKEAALRAALEAHLPFDTGWYGSKHEIASARIWVRYADHGVDFRDRKIKRLERCFAALDQSDIDTEDTP